MREADAGVARGRLDDRPAGLQHPVALGRLDHREADPVLDRAAGVQVLELREDPRAARRREPVEPHDRRAADEVEDRRVLARHRAEAYATTGCASVGISFFTRVSAAMTPAAEMPAMTQNASA